MRVAQIMLAKGFGGAERAFVDLCTALVARGHEVLAIGETRGLALERIGPHPNLTRIAVTCRGAWDRLAGYRIRRALAAYAPALVQAHLARAALLGGRAAHSLGLPSLAKTHDLVDLEYYRYLDTLVPTTQAQAAYLKNHGVPPGAICRIPNFSGLAAVAAVPEPHAATPTIKALGRFVRKKGFDLLIDSIATLTRSGRQLRLVIGGDGPERNALAAAIAEHHLAERVTLPGWIDDVATFLGDADLFVLPSREEPFGIVVLEAMARGVPIVATPTTGPREILTAATALLLEDITADALAGGLAVVLDDPLAARKRAEQALRVFCTEYSADCVVERYLALYARLCSSKP